MRSLEGSIGTSAFFGCPSPDGRKDRAAQFGVSFAFARILCSLLQRGSAFTKGFGPIKWRGDRAVALESEGGWGFGGIPLKIPRSLLRGASF